MWKDQKWQEMLSELKALPMTLEAIGIKIDVGRSFVCRMLKGESRPSLTTYEKIERLHRSKARAIKKRKDYW